MLLQAAAASLTQLLIVRRSNSVNAQKQANLYSEALAGPMSSTEVGDVLKPLLLKDLRTNCRARNLNPGGSRESLFERLKENMLDTQD